MFKSIDTRKSSITLTVFHSGVYSINDVSGYKYDKSSLSKIENLGLKVLHHMQGTPNTMQLNPHYNNVLLDIYDYFEKNIKDKFKDKKILIDPGIGFGKTLNHNLTLISKISLFHSLGFAYFNWDFRKDLVSRNIWKI